MILNINDPHLLIEQLEYAAKFIYTLRHTSISLVEKNKNEKTIEALIDLAKEIQEQVWKESIESKR